MTYSKNVTVKNRIIFRRILISWVIVFIIGTIFGYAISLFIVRSNVEEQGDAKVIQTSNETITEVQEPTILSEPEPNEPQKEVISLGEYKLTAYCSCVKCCGKWALNRPNGIVYGASGSELKSGYSIAVDPSVIPYGTEVIIDGVTYRADDCGGAIKGNRIDVYFDTHEEAVEFGVKYADVFMEVE